MALRIPDEAREPLSTLLKIPPEARMSLLEALRSSEPRIRPSELVDDLRGKVAVDDAVLASLVNLLVTLYWVRFNGGEDPDSFVDSLIDAIKAENDSQLKEPADGWVAFSETMRSLLSLDKTLAVTARALFVAYQHPCHVHRTRVLTDARPVFPTDAADGPAAFVISHTLQIVVHEEGKDREWFATLSTSDLEQLRSAVERALSKQASLKTALAKTDIPVFDWGD